MAVLSGGAVAVRLAAAPRRLRDEAAPGAGIWPPLRRALVEVMARGWESKAVEAQQDEASWRRPVASPSEAPDALARLAERRVVELARARAAADLARATRPAHRAMLEQAIAALDAQLARLPGAPRDAARGGGGA